MFQALVRLPLLTLESSTCLVIPTSFNWKMSSEHHARVLLWTRPGKFLVGSSRSFYFLLLICIGSLRLFSLSRFKFSGSNDSISIMCLSTILSPITHPFAYPLSFKLSFIYDYVVYLKDTTVNLRRENFSWEIVSSKLPCGPVYGALFWKYGRILSTVNNAISRQVILGCIRKASKTSHEEQAGKQHSSIVSVSVSSLSSCFGFPQQWTYLQADISNFLLKLLFPL